MKFDLNKNTREEITEFIFSQLKAGEQVDIAVEDGDEYITIETYLFEDGINCMICRGNTVLVDCLMSNDVKSLKKTDVEWFTRKI